MWLHLFTEQEKILHRKGFKLVSNGFGGRIRLEVGELVGTGQEEGLS